jgi:hypothetical protein
VLRFFVRVKDRDDLDACVAVVEPEDVRAQFDEAFRRFSQSLDMVLPDPRGLVVVVRGSRADTRWSWSGSRRATASSAALSSGTAVVRAAMRIWRPSRHPARTQARSAGLRRVLRPPVTAGPAHLSKDPQPLRGRSTAWRKSEGEVGYAVRLARLARSRSSRFVDAQEKSTPARDLGIPLVPR